MNRDYLKICKFCGKSILWVEIDGLNIPLDPVTTTYRWGKEGWEKSDSMVAHFSTCNPDKTGIKKIQNKDRE